MYTSGTTGVPKGVLTTHRNLSAAVDSSPLWGFDGDTVSLTPLPMFHIGGIGWTFLGIWNGAPTILVSEFDAAAVLDLLERERVTNAVFVPTILQMLCAVPGAADRDYSALRSIAYGASPITTPVLKAALRTFRCPLFGVYGLTETTGGVVQLDPEDHDPDGPREHLLRSAGRPLPWVELRIVDPATGDELGPRAVGEVWMRAPNVMAGYFNRPEETAAALTPDGWLRTGDGGYLDEEGTSSSPTGSRTWSSAAARTSTRSRSRRRWRTIPASRTSRSSACPTTAGVRRSRRSSSGLPARRDRRGADRLRARPAGRLQAASVRRVRRRAAPHALGKVLKRELRERYRSVSAAGR